MAVGGDTARDGELMVTALPAEHDGTRNERIGDGFLEGGTEIRNVDRCIHHFRLIDVVEDRRFDTGEGEIVRVVGHRPPRECDGLRVAAFRSSIDLRATRIAESDGTSHLIEGFTGSIIT